MTYAYRIAADGAITWWCSEADREPPAGYQRCDWATYRSGWCYRDIQTFAQLHALALRPRPGARVYPAPGPQPATIAREAGR